MSQNIGSHFVSHEPVGNTEHVSCGMQRHLPNLIRALLEVRQTGLPASMILCRTTMARFQSIICSKLFVRRAPIWPGPVYKTA
jgi:hypothetical protein